MPEPPHREDLELAQGVLRGDEAAQQLFGDRLTCVDRILSSRNARVGRQLDRHELEDLAQEVRATVWRKLADYRPIAALSSWIYGICEFQLRNAVRRKRRRPEIAALDAAPEAVAREDVAQPAFYGRVHAGLDRLDPLDQRIVRMKHFDSLTLDQIATALDLKLNTLKSRYFRALKRMRETLDQDHLEADE